MGEAALFALSVAVIPVLIKKLGPEGYALYSFMGIMAGYMSLFIAGSGAMSVRLVADALARDDRATFRQALRASLLLFVLGGGAGALIILSLRGYLAGKFLNVPPELVPTAETIFFFTAGGGLFYLLSMWCGFVVQGMQRFDLLNILSVFRGGLVPSGSLYLMLNGYPLKALGAWYLSANFAAFCLGLFWIRKPLFEALSESGPWLKGMGRQIREYNFNVFVGQLAWTINCQMDKAWIGHVRPISEVAYYVVPGSLAQRLGTVPSIICQVAFPMISEIGSKGDMAALRRLYIKGSKVVVLSLLPLFVILFVWAPQILKVWLGQAFEDHATWPMRLQLLGWSASILTVIPFHVALGLGKPVSNSYAAAASSAVILPLWAYLIPHHGIFGAALGFAIGQLIVAPSFVLYIGRKLVGVSAWDYFAGSYLIPTATGAVLAAAAWLLGPHLYRLDLLGLSTCALLGAYFVANFFLLDAEERAIFLRIFKRV
jgi:O-antigen/teichoic acid export membrane protein